MCLFCEKESYVDVEITIGNTTNIVSFCYECWTKITKAIREIDPNKIGV